MRVFDAHRLACAFVENILLSDPPGNGPSYAIRFGRMLGIIRRRE
jgi:hypothetical protein